MMYEFCFWGCIMIKVDVLPDGLMPQMMPVRKSGLKGAPGEDPTLKKGKKTQ